MIGDFLLTEVAAPLDGVLKGKDANFSRVCTDSRALQSGDLFVALRGERFDAHEFLPQAAAAGAGAAVVERPREDLDLPQLQVADTTRALGRLGQLNRRRFAGTVLAVTGSGGKTTVKTLLAEILGRRGPTYATRGNLNNQIGAPLSLLELRDDHRYAVIEMGASGPGEIAWLAEIAEPSVGVVTNALRAHVAGFGSLEGVARAKGELYTALGEGRTAVLNMDDAQVALWCRMADESRLLGFGIDNDSTQVRASELRDSEQGIAFLLDTPEGRSSVQLQLMGRHNAYNALAAAACAAAVGVDLATIREGLEGAVAVAGRMAVQPGPDGATLIDDSYNANPDAVRAAVDVLAARSGRRILLLGDMAELGSDAEGQHRELGEYARRAGLDNLYTVGPLSRAAAEAFGAGARHSACQAEAAAGLRGLCSPETTILIKGSRSAGMDRVVAALSLEG